MTNTKKIRLLTEYVEKGLGEQVVLTIKDRWDFGDPDVYPRNYKVREQFNVSDALNQFKEQQGYIYAAINIKDIQKIIEKNEPLVVIAEYKDTKDKFLAEHPNFQKEERARFNKLMGMYNRYKSQFI